MFLSSSHQTMLKKLRRQLMALTADEKEAIMAARGDSGRAMTGGNMSWQVTLEGSKPFTFITEFCSTPDQVEAAMFEKFRKQITGLKLL